MAVFHARERDVPTTELEPHRGTGYSLVTRENGSANVDVFLNVFRSASGDGPYHYHTESESVYVIIQGRGRVRVDGREFEVDRGDAVYIKPGERHDIVNIGEDELRVIEVQSPRGADFVKVAR